MRRLSDTILNMANDEAYSIEQRSLRIQAAIEGYQHTITHEIADTLLDGEKMVKFVDRIDLKHRVHEVLKKHI